jgi:hypothetical protein
MISPSKMRAFLRDVLFVVAGTALGWWLGVPARPGAGSGVPRPGDEVMPCQGFFAAADGTVTGHGRVNEVSSYSYSYSCAYSSRRTTSIKVKKYRTFLLGFSRPVLTIFIPPP